MVERSCTLPHDFHLGGSWEALAVPLRPVPHLDTSTDLSCTKTTDSSRFAIRPCREADEFIPTDSEVFVVNVVK
jgi:hypothetical protein